MARRSSFNSAQPPVDRTLKIYGAKAVPTILVREKATGDVVRINHDHVYDIDKFERINEE